MHGQFGKYSLKSKSYILEIHFKLEINFLLIAKTRSDILQGQALFREVKQLRRCLGMLNNFEKISFPLKKD